MSPSLLQQLIDSLQCLPGVGAKTAQRMAYHLLQRKREAGKALAQVLSEAMDEIGQCNTCRNYTEEEQCHICQNPKRAVNNTLCVVETAADLLAIEQSGQYTGKYFVLHGTLSPLDGVGPSEIGLFQLEDIIVKNQVAEVILALNPSVEGEATSHFIADICRDAEVSITRIAHGIPVGGELEMVDTSTITHALMGRKSL
jgi:recombination protein RecR